jgi:hypothetical protein
MKHDRPNLALRDWLGAAGVLVLGVALVIAAFATHAGPFLLLAILVVLTFIFLRISRERGREEERKEVRKALRTQLLKGERLLAVTVGDRRRVKPLATVSDLALMLISQGLATRGGITVDDTCVGLTDQRLIVIDREKRPAGQGKSWRDWLNLRRLEADVGSHAVLFESRRHNTCCQLRLAVFYLARLSLRTQQGERFSIGINSRYWAERAIELCQKSEGTPANETNS